MTDNIPGLKVEPNDDGTLTLEQDWLGNVDRVTVHPVHIRHLAERLGLIAINCGPSVAELQRESRRLKRNLLQLREHALALQVDFAQNADWKHADLTHEMNNINALVSLFDMAVDDYSDDHATSSPKTDASETPPKTGAFAVDAGSSEKASGKPSAKPGQLALEV